MRQSAAIRSPLPQTVPCHNCGFLIFDGQVFRARVLRLLPNGATDAKCSKCKTWVRTPLVMTSDT